MSKMLGQPGMDEEIAADDPVRLRISGALHPALRKIDEEMAAHLVDHHLQMLFLAGLRCFLRKPDRLAAALQIDQPGQ
jgi:hypothetical protein